MISDLEKIDADKASDVKKAINGLSNNKIARRLQDANSELCKAIPKDVLQKDAAGRRYLDVFGMIQPTLRPEKVAKSTESETRLTSNMQLIPNLPSGVEGDANVSEFVKMFSKNMDKDLLRLAENVRKDIDMSEADLHDMMKSMDIGKMMSVFSKMGTSMQKEVEKGNVDLEKLHSQAMSFVDNVKETPEFNKMVEENPMLANMMKNGGDPGAIQNAMSVMQMMGGLGDVSGLGGLGNNMEGTSEMGGLGDMMSNIMSGMSGMSGIPGGTSCCPLTEKEQGNEQEKEKTEKKTDMESMD